MPNLTNSQEPEPFFWPLGAGAARKKYQEPEPEPLGEKIRSRSRLKKKSGAGAAKKLAGSPTLFVTYLFTLFDNMFVGNKKKVMDTLIDGCTQKNCKKYKLFYMGLPLSSLVLGIILKMSHFKTHSRKLGKKVNLLYVNKNYF